MSIELKNNPNYLQHWIRSVLDPQKYDSSLVTMLETVPLLSTFKDVKPDSTVLIRADLDVPIKKGVVEDISRLESFKATIDFCREHKLKPLLFGHVGRKPENTGAPIALALSDLYKTKVHFVDDWFNETSCTVTENCQKTIFEAHSPEIILLQNTRKYSFECALWDVDLDSINDLAQGLHRVTLAVSQSISRNYIFDAVASSNHDWSSVVVPAFMKYAAISDEILGEFKEHIAPASRAQIVIFSGLKMDKLDDLELLVNRGHVKLVLVGGALAMALMKAQGLMDNHYVSIGLADADQSKGEPYYISSDRVQQAVRILTNAMQHGVKFVMPIDFILDDGSVSENIPSDHFQMDVGPKTLREFDSALTEIMASIKYAPLALYFNGVFGKFEDKRFESGTKFVIGLLEKLTEAGVKTYVGGGEGLLALRKYGDVNRVTHAFTSGGTILKAMSGRVISYLSSLSLFAKEQNFIARTDE